MKFYELDGLQNDKNGKAILMSIPFIEPDILEKKYCGGGPDLSFLNGKEIVKVGFLSIDSREGGLTIDYKDGEEIKRLVLGFNDIGAWIVVNF
jgi:hypothetical protein